MIKKSFGLMHCKWLLDLENETQSVFSDIISEISDKLKKSTNSDKHVLVKLMFCDELMSNYYQNGYRKFEIVLMQDFRGPRLRIRIKGLQRYIEDEMENKNGLNKDEIHLLIQKYILKNGMAWTNYRYVGMSNEFTVLLKENDEELSDNILKFYQEKGDIIKEKPLLLVAELIRLDPFRSIGVVINRVIKRGAFMLVPVCVADVIDCVIEGKPFFSIKTVMMFLCALILIIINCICNNHLDNYFWSQRTRDIENALKSAVLRKMQLMSVDFINKIASGTVFSKIIKDAESIRLFLSKAIDVSIQIVTDLIIILVMSMKDCPRMLVFYTVTVPISVLLLTYYKKPILTVNERYRKSVEKSNAVIRDMQEMWQVSRLHGVTRTEYNMIRHELKNVRQIGGETDTVRHRFTTACFFCFQFFQLLCLGFSIYLASIGSISIGMVVMFRTYFESLVNSVTKAIDAIPEITQGYESLRSLNEILSSTELEPDGDYKLTTPISGEVVFKDVVYRYPGADRPIIDHLSFKIPAGKSIALIGESGVGKTTIINLLTGLLQKESGEILIDGRDIDTLNKKSYRYQIAVVPQNSVLFSGKLFENIVYGKSYVSTDDVYSVLEDIGLMSMIDDLPEGLNSPVMESGKNFSGGQRQRISIARAMLRNPRLLIFDEATSALDVESETQVQKAIDRMKGRCTIIMIAHRLTTIKNCDLIIKIKSDGNVDLFDNYDEFMKTTSVS